MDILDRPSHPDPANTSNRAIALRFGAIWAASSILVSLIGFLTDTDPNMPSTGPIKWVYILFGLGVSIWAVVNAIKQDRAQLGGYITLGRCVGLGTLMGLISGALGAVYTVLYTLVINPDYKEQMSAAMQSEWEKQGMSEEQIEMALSMAGAFISPTFMAISQVFGGALIGVIIGLIAGLFMKRESFPNR